MNVFALPVGERLGKDVFERLLGFVEAEREGQIRKFRRWEDAQRGLFGQLLLRWIVCEEKGIRNAELRILKNEHGKPWLANDPEFHFNLSHSGDWVVCATDETPVGIDVERVKRADVSIADRFFSEIENRDLVSLPEEKRLDYFITVWVLKESFLKATGKGLGLSLTSFDLRALDPQAVQWSGPEEYAKYGFFKLYDFDTGYKLAVCGQHPCFPEKIEIVRVTDLISFFL